MSFLCHPCCPSKLYRSCCSRCCWGLLSLLLLCRCDSFSWNWYDCRKCQKATTESRIQQATVKLHYGHGSFGAKNLNLPFPCYWQHFKLRNLPLLLLFDVWSCLSFFAVVFPSVSHVVCTIAAAYFQDATQLKKSRSRERTKPRSQTNNKDQKEIKQSQKVTKPTKNQEAKSHKSR